MQFHSKLFLVFFLGFIVVNHVSGQSFENAKESIQLDQPIAFLPMSDILMAGKTEQVMVFGSRKKENIQAVKQILIDHLYPDRKSLKVSYKTSKGENIEIINFPANSVVANGVYVGSKGERIGALKFPANSLVAFKIKSRLNLVLGRDQNGLAKTNVGRSQFLGSRGVIKLDRTIAVVSLNDIRMAGKNDASKLVNNILMEGKNDASNLVLVFGSQKKEQVEMVKTMLAEVSFPKKPEGIDNGFFSSAKVHFHAVSFPADRNMALKIASKFQMQVDEDYKVGTVQGIVESSQPPVGSFPVQGKSSYPPGYRQIKK